MGLSLLVYSLIVAFVILPPVMAVVVWMDRRGILHEADTWLPGARARRLQESIDRIDTRLAAIERKLDDR